MVAVGLHYIVFLLVNNVGVYRFETLVSGAIAESKQSFSREIVFYSGIDQRVQDGGIPASFLLQYTHFGRRRGWRRW